MSHTEPVPQWKLEQRHIVRDSLRRHLNVTDSNDLTSKLFDFLVNRTFEGLKASSGLPPLTSKEVVRSIYKRNSTDDEETLGRKVRKLKSHLKDRLELFACSDQGKRLPMSILVDSPAWELKIVEQAPGTKRFWEPYFQLCTAVRVVYAENIFFRTGDDKRTFIRHMDVNDLATGSEKIRKRWKPLQSLELLPGRQYVSAGDCAAAISLTQQFERHRLPTILTKAHHMDDWYPGEREGVIVVGNGRIIPWLYERLQTEQFNFRIEDGGIEDRKRGLITADDPSSRIVQGIVSRTFSKDLQCWLTILAANHGRFNECFANYLFSERDLPVLFDAMQWNNPKQLPATFDFRATVDINLAEDLKKQPGRGVKVVMKDA